MNLQGLGVASLPQALNGPGMPKEMRVNPLIDPGLFSDFLNNLPSSPAVDPEDSILQPQLAVEGEALEAMGQAVRTGYQAGFVTFTHDIENSSSLMGADAAVGQAQGLGDAQTRLEKGEDQELIPKPVAPLAGGRQTGHLFPGQVGDDAQGLGYHGLGDEGATGHVKLDKSDFSPILLPTAG